MSDAAAPPCWTGPGLLQTFITISPTSELRIETLEKWLDDVYIPALIGTGAVQSAWRFKAVDPGYGKQHMVLYKIPDLAQVQAGKLQQAPRASELFPKGGTVDDYVLGESKIFSFVELYPPDTREQKEGRRLVSTVRPSDKLTLADAGSTIIMAAMEPSPGGEKDLDAWYRDEHNEQMSKEPGYLRTTRFSLVFQHRTDGKAMETVSFLALHEFGEGHKVGSKVEPLDPMTDWTKRCMTNAKAIDAAVYRKVKSFGRAAESS
ncbi:hypothetical protein EJ04DRAFT_551415 [Polyplosphaeria fusca]|uniref:Uncharacterized protein n=1 Tax=Polyplosphaeria fusca TaxID=682080 RepID=A0A9P4V5G9_9PLEO|nr:hypothetical protein EJ04DRAFT_551415 [Polyplosphaeria fusca]